MKYLIECTASKKDGNFDDAEIKVELAIDVVRENTSVIFDMGDSKDWWVPISELDNLMSIINGIFKEK